MKTLIVNIQDPMALKFVRELEERNLLEIVSTRVVKSTKKISDQLRGSVSPEQAEKMHEELRQMRNEWERDIC